MKGCPSTRVSRPQDLMLCHTGLAEQVTKAASDALLAAVPFPGQICALRLKLSFLLGKDAQKS